MPAEQRSQRAPAEKSEPWPPVVPPPVAQHRYPSQSEGQAILVRLFPEGVEDPAGWARELFRAFSALQIPATRENFCTAIAVIEQESTFHVDPVVSGLSRVAWNEIEKRRKRLGIPKLLLDAALTTRSRNGRTYKARIDALRTEAQMSVLFEDMIAEFPYGDHLFARYNPVRTGGPMQVSVEFAQEQLRTAPYPYPSMRSVRHEVFSRRGGLYFGIAYLLDYPAPYAAPLYRFADFNAGRYSSRNAAFQNAVAKISRRRLTLDGDLLRYSKIGLPSGAPGDTKRALDAISGRLHLSSAGIGRDLNLEKSASFQDTALYRRIFALADQINGEKLSRAMLPQIDLKSPKIKRHLTTAWFAKRVERRYRTCLDRGTVVPDS